MLVSSAWTILALITTSAMAQKAHVLIFSATNGFRHGTRPHLNSLEIALMERYLQNPSP